MRIKCSNCGEINLIDLGNVLKCSTCGTEFSKRELYEDFEQMKDELNQFNKAVKANVSYRNDIVNEDKISALSNQMQNIAQSIDTMQDFVNDLSNDVTDINKKIDLELQSIKDMFLKDRDKLQSHIDVAVQKAIEGKDNGDYIENFLRVANTDDMFNMLASSLYSVIEHNILHSNKFLYIKNKFVLPVVEYDELLKQLCLNGLSLNSIPSIRTVFNNGIEYIEVPPLLRFYKMGLSVLDAKEAARRWKFINAFRHRSTASEQLIKTTFTSVESKRCFFRSTIEFFTKHKLYKR